MAETGKNKDSVEIMIPVVGSEHEKGQGFGSSFLTHNTANSQQETEGLRQRRMAESDTVPQNKLLLRRPSSIGRTKYSQTKSRVMEVEPTSPAANSNLSRQSSGKGASRSFSGRIESLKVGSLPPATHDHRDDEDDEDDDGTKRKQQDEVVVGGSDDKKNDNGENHSPRKSMKKGKITLVAIIGVVEWTIFLGVVGLLVASLCVDKLKTSVIWGLEIWKWCVLAAVFFCGHLVTQWARDLIVFLIENKYFFNEKVVYFVHGLKQSVRVVIWLSLVLLAWFLLIDRGVKRSKKTTRILNYITRAFAASLIGAVLWMIKTLLVKSVAASFHVKTFFSKIREAISHEYILWTLSLPPKVNNSDQNGGDGLITCLCFKIPNWRKSSKDSKEKDEEITIKKLGKMKAGKMPVSTMGHLIDRIRSSKLSIISSVLDDSPGLIGEQKQITSAPEVEEAASQIFHNVKSPNQDYIEKKDLSPFKNEENEDCLLEWFEKVAQDGKISEETLKNWAINIYKEREFLSYSLKDAKTAIEELNRVLSAIVLVLILIVYLLLMGLATTKLLVVLSSQLLVAVFIFGNTCKTVFEAMIFVFVMHPFDVGDRCVVDGVQLIVEEMDILKTTFLRYDNEIIYYPNSVLATKAISNYNRSPERMGDSVNFDIDVFTSREDIQSLRARIKEYVDENPQYWHPNHSVQVKEIENMNKMKMVLFVNHKMNFQNFLEKMNRRTELMLALKSIFEDLGIRYHLLPQEVQISHLGSAVPATSTHSMPSRISSIL